MALQEGALTFMTPANSTALSVDPATGFLVAASSLSASQASGSIYTNQVCNLNCFCSQNAFQGIAWTCHCSQNSCLHVSSQSECIAASRLHCLDKKEALTLHVRIKKALCIGQVNVTNDSIVCMPSQGSFLYTGF